MFEQPEVPGSNSQMTCLSLNTRYTLPGGIYIVYRKKNLDLSSPGLLDIIRSCLLLDVPNICMLFPPVPVCYHITHLCTHLFVNRFLCASNICSTSQTSIVIHGRCEDSCIELCFSRVPNRPLQGCLLPKVTVRNVGTTLCTGAAAFDAPHHPPRKPSLPLPTLLLTTPPQHPH
jgi:hypothetical protein